METSYLFLLAILVFMVWMAGHEIQYNRRVKRAKRFVKQMKREEDEHNVTIHGKKATGNS